MRHDQQHGVGRRLLEDLQHRVGAVAVHLVGRIDDGDPPFAHRRRHMHEGAELAHVVDGDLGAHAAGVGIERAPQMEQVGVRAGVDQRSAGRVGRHIEAVGFAAEQAGLGLAGSAGSARSARRAWPCRCRAAPPAARHGAGGRSDGRRAWSFPPSRGPAGVRCATAAASRTAIRASRARSRRCSPCPSPSASDSQPFAYHARDRGGDRVDIPCSIDHHAALGILVGDFEEAAAHAGMKIARQALVARLAPAAGGGA